MRKLLNIFIVTAGFVKISCAQDIHFTVATRNSDCNGTNNGQARINVVQEHPPYTYLWNTGNTTDNISGLAPGNYSVTVADSSGQDTVMHITISELQCFLAAALVFTPNGDGYNDTWPISNIEFYPDNLILVYNRWGQKVYEHRGVYEPWDGKDLLGVPVPDNTYYYIIYGDKKEEKSIVKGTVSIIR